MCKAKNLVTSIEVDIDAPASLVWEVLTDLERYPQWNPFCPRIESTLKLGDPVHMHISVPGTSETQPVSETLVACKPQRLLSWEMRPTAENKDAARREAGHRRQARHPTARARERPRGRRGHGARCVARQQSRRVARAARFRRAGALLRPPPRRRAAAAPEFRSAYRHRGRGLHQHA